MKLPLRYFAFTALLSISLADTRTLSAQQLAATAASDALFPAPTLYSSSALPEAPAPQAAVQPQGPGTASYETADHTDGQTKRILGIIPNFRAVSAGTKLPPQSVKEKFITASEDSFDYSSIVFPAIIALYNEGGNKDPEFGKGGVGYGRYFWHAVVDQTSENYFVEFIVPAVTHEDTRYYTLGHGGFLKRTEYSISRIVITRSDSGKEVFNAGEVLGAGMSAGVSNLYYPSRERTVGNTLSQWGLNVGIDAGVFTFKEFWPDLNHFLFHGNKPFKGPTSSGQ
jgi:hypothetical protein